MPKTKDPVWTNYECIRTKNSGLWAKCRKCGKEMQGIPHRLKKHLTVCPRPTSEPEPHLTVCPPTSVPEPSLTPQVKFLPQSSATSSNQSNENSTHLTITKNIEVTTTKDYEEKINLQIAKYFYTSNTAFNHVENGEFIKLCSLLRPDYKPPTAYQIGNLILNKVLTESMTQVKKEIQ